MTIAAFQELAGPLPVDLLGRLGLAVLLGGAIGLERELSEKPAGLRTNILICLGAALFSELSVHFTLWGSSGTPADPSRIASQIVSGIGFLGAGAIIQSRANVTGLTTAATIWVVAAIGMAVGSGAMAPAIWGTVLILLVLVGLGALERRMDMGWTGLEIRLRLRNQEGEQERVLTILEEMGLRIRVGKVQKDVQKGVREIRVRSRVARRSLRSLSEDLVSIPEVATLYPD